jgi:hypothetical protein
MFAPVMMGFGDNGDNIFDFFIELEVRPRREI